MFSLCDPSQLADTKFTPKKIEEGSARALISRFDVKKRVYFGNTSMEAEISLLMANQCLVSPSKQSFVLQTNFTLQARPGSLVYDPFMGTGSMAYVGHSGVSGSHYFIVPFSQPPTLGVSSLDRISTVDKCVEKVNNLRGNTPP